MAGIAFQLLFWRCSLRGVIRCGSVCPVLIGILGTVGNSGCYTIEGAKESSPLQIYRAGFKYLLSQEVMAAERSVVKNGGGIEVDTYVPCLDYEPSDLLGYDELMRLSSSKEYENSYKAQLRVPCVSHRLLALQELSIGKGNNFVVRFWPIDSVSFAPLTVVVCTVLDNRAGEAEPSFVDPETRRQGFVIALDPKLNGIRCFSR